MYVNPKKGARFEANASKYHIKYQCDTDRQSTTMYLLLFCSTKLKLYKKHTPKSQIQ